MNTLKNDVTFPLVTINGRWLRLAVVFARRDINAAVEWLYNSIQRTRCVYIICIYKYIYLYILPRLAAQHKRSKMRVICKRVDNRFRTKHVHHCRGEYLKNRTLIMVRETQKCLSEMACNGRRGYTQLLQCAITPCVQVKTFFLNFYSKRNYEDAFL